MEGNLLTPGDVRDATFDMTPLFHRGYDPDQVDELLDRVRDTINRLAKTLETLQKETKK